MAWAHTYREGQIGPGTTITGDSPGKQIAKAITEIQEKAPNDVAVENNSKLVELNADITDNVLQIRVTDLPSEPEGSDDNAPDSSGDTLPSDGADGMYLRFSPDGNHYWDYVRAIDTSQLG